MPDPNLPRLVTGLSPTWPATSPTGTAPCDPTTTRYNYLLAACGGPKPRMGSDLGFSYHGPDAVSGDGVVVVEESAEDLAASDVRGGDGDDRRVVRRGAQGRRAVRAAGVVVLGVSLEDASWMPFVVDEQSVGALGPEGADPAFRVPGHGTDSATRRARSAQVKRAWRGPKCRSKTASWWPSARISAYFTASLRASSRCAAKACDVQVSEAHQHERSSCPGVETAPEAGDLRGRRFGTHRLRGWVKQDKTDRGLCVHRGGEDHPRCRFPAPAAEGGPLLVPCLAGRRVRPGRAPGGLRRRA
jgi:hypothetical protein